MSNLLATLTESKLPALPSEREPEELTEREPATDSEVIRRSPDEVVESWQRRPAWVAERYTRPAGTEERHYEQPAAYETKRAAAQQPAQQPVAQPPVVITNGAIAQAYDPIADVITGDLTQSQLVESD